MKTLTVVNALELAAAYAVASYGVRLGGEQLGFRVGERAPDLEDRWPATSYAFITAWNPASSPRPDDANHAADALLTARLSEMEVGCKPAWARSRDGQWHEPGWLLAQVDDTIADELGIAFGQAAILAWDAGKRVTLRMLMPEPATDSAAANTPFPAELAASVRWLGG